MGIVVQRDVEEVMLECVGGLLKVAIDDALSAGLENFGEHDRKNVKRAIEVCGISHIHNCDALVNGSPNTAFSTSILCNGLCV